MTFFIWFGSMTAAALAGALASHYVPRLLNRRNAIAVHIEVNPALMYAGEPNWDGFSYVLTGETREQLPTPPTHVCREWRDWIWGSGVADADRTVLRVTLQASEDVPIAVDGLTVEVVARRAADGLVIHCPVGGAEASPRALRVDLDEDPALVQYVDEIGEPLSRPSFVLSKGETEIFNIEASTRDSYCEWVAELLLVVAGKRRRVKIDDKGQPFRTAGSHGLESVVWDFDRWVGSAGALPS